MNRPRTMAILGFGTHNQRSGITYHLAHKLADRREGVLVVDFGVDPFLSERLLGEQRLLEIWTNSAYQSWWQSLNELEPLIVTEGISLLPGDPRLALWHPAGLEDLRGRIAVAARKRGADWVLVVAGSSISPATLAALRLVSALVLVIGPQPRSLRALPVAGQLLRELGSDPSLLGYLVPQSLQRIFGPNDLYARCLAELPNAFRSAFGLEAAEPLPRPQEDPFCLGLIERPAGLYELAAETAKPAFHVRPADGASESLLHAAFEADRIYGQLVDRITRRYDELVTG